MKFNAAHKLYSDKFTAEENKEIYGPCCNVHGHNYTLEVHLYGEIDQSTGMVINISDVKKILHEKIHAVLDHRYLNDDVDFFKHNIPTVENIAVFCWQELKETALGPLLDKLKLFETDKNICEYRG